MERLRPRKIQPKGAEKLPPAPQTAAYHPKVVGSNPAIEKRNPLISVEIGGFSLLYPLENIFGK
ncbi:MAG: hypothetical protein HFF19_00625 [Oscillospiraceae bacterium]|nr:hypothetical protein [Oscillospiraceae bacterium]